MRKFILCFLVSLFCGASVIAQIKTLPFNKYITERKGLPNAYEAISVKKNATVAFLGGSITYNSGWRDKVCAYLKERFPATKFHFIAAGIPSLGSLPHAFRLSRDVLDSGKVDLLFLEAAVNDQVNRTDSITQVRALEGIIRHAKTNNPLMDIVMMSFADPDKTKLYDSGIVPTSVANHELIADHYELPSINLAKAVRDKLANNEFNWEKDFKDLHPSPFGQELYFEAIKDLLSSNFASFSKSANKKQKATRLPALLNKGSFTRGKYLSIDNAENKTGWELVKNWTPTDGLSTRPGFVNVPMLVSATAGSSFTLKFKGTAIGMAIVSGSDAGIVSYSIDNAAEKQLDLFTEWSSSLHLPWYVLFGSNLTNTDHVLKVTISSAKNQNSKGTACRIVNFLIN
nr:SGNH/GDSL hydrolase family protein [Pedobacter panaciterrae]